MEEVLVLDFGGQYSQLIARRIRECGVFAELLPANTSVEKIRERKPKGLILSGGPASVYEPGAPKFPTQLLDLGIPMLGICYGMQAMVLALGGRVESAETGEFGRTDLVLRDGGGKLLGGLPEEQSCWMSHRDAVFEAPEGFTALASSPSSPVAACELPDRGLYGIQFHPEVVHTPYGTEILTRFLRDVAGCEEQWSPQSVIAEQVEKIQAQVGDGKVICGLSGGVDSSVAALLVHKAVGDKLTCVFVDHGLMRMNEAEQVVEAFGQFGIPLVHVDAEERFLAKLAGKDDPEEKRKIIGAEFIRVFEEEADEARGRQLPGPGHALLGRDRVRWLRPRGDDQVPPQRRRPARRPRVRAGRAAADAVQGRGAGGRRRARPAGADGLAPALPRARASGSGSSAARSTKSASTSSAPPTRSCRRRSAPPSSTASSGSPSASCRSSARSASRATAAPTPTRS